MKTVPFAHILSMDISISGITSIYQKPVWETLRQPESGRILNGFLLIDRGECTYRFGNEELHLSRGDLIYLPTGSVHSVLKNSEDLAYYRISFTMTDAETGERIIFSNGPVLFTGKSENTIFSLAEELTKCTFSANMLRRISVLSEFLDALSSSMHHYKPSPISPAVRYIRDHFTEDLNVSDLAKMCYISESHLFRLFKKEFSQSPIDYRNSLRIDLAEKLLMGESDSVTDIAVYLGFENIYYFSRIFKEKKGMSPSEFRRHS